MRNPGVVNCFWHMAKHGTSSGYPYRVLGYKAVGSLLISQFNENERIQKVLSEGIRVKKTLTFWRKDPNTTISGLSSYHLNGVSLACRWLSIDCWLGSFLIFQGIRTSIAKKPYIFVIFLGVVCPEPLPPPPSRSGSAHVGYFLMIRENRTPSIPPHIQSLVYLRKTEELTKV